MRESWAAIVLQGAKQRIGIDLIARAGQETTGIVAADVVTVRRHCAAAVENVCARSCVQNRVCDLKCRAIVDATS